jgi:hypothetical protein
MFSERSHSPSLDTDDMDLRAPLDIQLLGRSAAQDWLAHVILTVKTIAAGAEFIPLPYIRAAFGTVVIFLETVDVRIISNHYSRVDRDPENEQEPGRFAGLVCRRR